jgi:hypothetical protein
MKTGSSMRARSATAGAIVVAMTMLFCSGPAGAEPPLPAPGTASQVAALVASSSKIQRLPNNLVPSLFDVVNDDTSSYYPVTQRGCAGTSQCEFGDKKGTTSLVLFGDSHAYMWLPAIVPLAVKHHYRLILLWSAGCPAAWVTVWNPLTNTANTACNQFRARSIAAIRALKPTLVLLASRTTKVVGTNGKPISDATWKSGLERTITSIMTKATKVAVIGDVTEFPVLLPDCLAAEPTHVQACSSPDPDPKIPDHFAAEEAAAAATHVHYLNPHKWLCTTICSPVIGTYVAFYNDNHVTATYAAYLSAVFGAAVLALLPALKR